MKQLIGPVAMDKKPLPVSNDRDDGRSQYANDENKDRGNWAGRLDFILSLVGCVSQRPISVYFCVLKNSNPVLDKLDVSDKSHKYRPIDLGNRSRPMLSLCSGVASYVEPRRVPLRLPISYFRGIMHFSFAQILTVTRAVFTRATLC